MCPLGFHNYKSIVSILTETRCGSIVVSTLSFKYIKRYNRTVALPGLRTLQSVKIGHQCQCFIRDISDTIPVLEINLLFVYVDRVFRWSPELLPIYFCRFREPAKSCFCRRSLYRGETNIRRTVVTVYGWVFLNY